MAKKKSEFEGFFDIMETFFTSLFIVLLIELPIILGGVIIAIKIATKGDNEASIVGTGFLFVVIGVFMRTMIKKYAKELVW